jgi:phosphopantothenoylcysteine decarboxylase/phosphopantothenate--cysteine ligase
VSVVHIETARDMLAACERTLPVDVAVCAAAVSDWRVEAPAAAKIKKNGAPPELALTRNPDILRSLSQAGNRRPRLVVGFAAETEDVVANARGKQRDKGCDWVVANDVGPATDTFGGGDNTVHLVTADAVEDWPRMTKDAVAVALADRIAARLAPAEGAAAEGAAAKGAAE